MSAWAMWSAIKRVPLAVWAATAGLALVSSLWIGHEVSVTRAYERGKRDAQSGVAFDSTMQTRAAAVVAMRVAKTDTAQQRVQRTQRRVREALTAVPDSIRALPPVDTLMRVVSTLLIEVDSLHGAISAERAAWTERAKVDSAAIHALRIIATAQQDTIRTLTKRPRWRTVLKTGAVMVVAGYVGGRLHGMRQQSARCVGDGVVPTTCAWRASVRPYETPEN